jgi:hypothetical protein
MSAVIELLEQAKSIVRIAERDARNGASPAALLDSIEAALERLQVVKRLLLPRPDREAPGPRRDIDS